MKVISLWISILFLGLLTSCNLQGYIEPTQLPTLAPTILPTLTALPTLTTAPTALPTPTIAEITTSEPLSLSITLGKKNVSNGITLDSGGDVDTQPVEVNSAEARQSGNGTALTSGDLNNVPDSYFQFNIDDGLLFEGAPTAHVRVEVDYLDQGTDTFSLQYDAKPSGGSNGIFAGGGGVVKTNSGEFRTAVFNLCDANFANRDNGADFRLGDDQNGAETFREVRILGLGSHETAVLVDDFGANPMDTQPDSDAIQAALDSTCSGDTIVFTSGVNTSGYQGYLVDKTLFLTGMSAKHNLTFTSSNPDDHALLRATADLKGYVVRLFARSRFNNTQGLYNIDFGYIDIHGGRDVRVCMGADQISNGIGDNWGSWLPECNVTEDPWCSPGNIGFDGFSNNVTVHDLIDQQGECGSALAFGGAYGTIQNVTIDTAGDHVHASGCTNTDNDGDYGGWSDGITMVGPGHKIIDNTIINPSDVGVVTFGGQDVTIANNIFKITAGNYGAFAAIALHPWDTGNTSGVKVTGNTITSEGDSRCGGLHVGINIGSHMWGGACITNPGPYTFGNPTCSLNPNPDDVVACTSGMCQIWLVLPESETLTLKDNNVTGAHLNYLVEGFLIKGQFVDENNVSSLPRQSDWDAARLGCNGVFWGPKDKVAHHPTLPGYTDLLIHCER